MKVKLQRGENLIKFEGTDSEWLTFTNSRPDPQVIQAVFTQITQQPQLSPAPTQHLLAPQQLPQLPPPIEPSPAQNFPPAFPVHPEPIQYPQDWTEPAPTVLQEKTMLGMEALTRALKLDGAKGQKFLNTWTVMVAIWLFIGGVILLKQPQLLSNFFSPVKSTPAAISGKEVKPEAKKPVPEKSKSEAPKPKIAEPPPTPPGMESL